MGQLINTARSYYREADRQVTQIQQLSSFGDREGRNHRCPGVTVRVFVMLDIYFVSVKYVFVTVKLVCVCVKLLKI
jgi:hypothetical protein